MPDRCRDSGPREKPVDVLVVDDHADSAAMIAELLEFRGCLARQAADAESALEAVRRRVPDVIVTDLVLGAGAAGWTLAEAVREDARTREVALIAVSGRVEPDWKVVRPFDAYLRKPVDLDVLAKLVLQLAERARATRTQAGGHR